MLHSNVVEPKTKCCTLMCVKQLPNDTVQCGTPYIILLYIVYFSTTLEAKPSAEDELPFVESVLGTVNEAFDKSTDSTEIKLNY